MNLVSQQPTPLLTVPELANALNISTHFIYKRTTSKSLDPLPFVALGRGKRFDLSAVKAHLATRQKSSPGGIVSAHEGTARVNGKAIRRMTRKRFQTGSVRLREDRKQPWWEGSYWQDVVNEDRTFTRKKKTVNLGLFTDVPTKRLALRKLSEILSEINDTNYRPKSDITFRSFVSKYRELKLKTKKGTTKHGYENNIRKHFVPYFADEKLTEIDTELIQAFINDKKAEGYASPTLHNMKFGLSAIFQAAVTWKYLKENPVREVELPPADVEEPVVLPKADHLSLLISSLEEPYSTAVWFHAVTCVRPSEGFAFKFSDLNVEENYLIVSRAVNRGDIHTPKYHRVNRPISLTADDVEQLLIYKHKMGLTDNDWIFPSKNREAALRHEDVLSRKIQPKAKELGLPHVTWRILRKWGSTHLIASRQDVKAVQARLGHSRPDIVLKHYAQLVDESAQDAARCLSGKLSKKSLLGNVKTTIQ